MVREPRGEDAAPLTELQERLLPGVALGPRQERERLWRWLLASPCGARALVAERAGRLVGAVAGFAVPTLAAGERVRWTAVVELLGESPERTAELWARFEERHGGAGGERDRLFFALPARERAGVEHERLGFAVVRSQDRLVLAAGTSREGVAAGVELRESAALPPECAALAERAGAGGGAVARREPAFLRWRFEEHPARAHRCLSARERASGALHGYAVLRPGAFEGEPCLLVCDWLVLPDARAARESLRAALDARARALGLPAVVACFPESAVEFLDFQRAGFRVLPTRSYLMARSFLRGQDSWWLYWSWYATLLELEPC